MKIRVMKIILLTAVGKATAQTQTCLRKKSRVERLLKPKCFGANELG